jgi:hypothetical protein
MTKLAGDKHIHEARAARQKTEAHFPGQTSHTNEHANLQHGHTSHSAFPTAAPTKAPTAPTMAPTAPTAFPTAAPAGVPATWTAAVNVDTSTPGYLTKNGGGGNWQNAGAISTQVFEASSTTPQGVSFKCHGDYAWGGSMIAGLDGTNNGLSFRDIEFGIGCEGGTLYIYENGHYYSGHGRYIATDLFQVQAIGSTIQYLKNDVVFYTSTKTATFPLHVDVDLHDGTLADVMIMMPSQ